LYRGHVEDESINKNKRHKDFEEGYKYEMKENIIDVSLE